jgi:hypothetical protein
MSSFMMVRLKPYNPRRKHVIRTFVHGKSGTKFLEAHGWYRVDESIAKELRDARQIEGDEYSPDAFDVCTLPEAKRIDAKEKKELERKAAGDANDLTTGDLHGRRSAADAGEAIRDRNADARATRHGSQRGQDATPAARARAPKKARAPRSMSAAAD